jgi:uncharacterized membrane protein YesL
MFGFLIKKAFFDMWDNLFRVVILNLGYIICASGIIFLPGLLVSVVPLSVAVLVICVVILFVYTGAASQVARDIADYGTPGFRDFWGYVKRTALGSALFGVIIAVQVAVLWFAFQFYSNLNSIVGFLAMAFIFWVAVLWTLASVYFFPVQSRLNTDIRKVIRKMLLLFFDNTLFTLGLVLGSLIVLVISAFTAFLLPGIATILVWLNVALKVRMYKYDYLEQHPEANRRKIPWDALLIDDRERVGKRTLRGMIFPWKE